MLAITLTGAYVDPAAMGAPVKIQDSLVRAFIKERMAADTELTETAARKQLIKSPTEVLDKLAVAHMIRSTTGSAVKMLSFIKNWTAPQYTTTIPTLTVVEVKSSEVATVVEANPFQLMCKDEEVVKEYDDNNMFTISAPLTEGATEQRIESVAYQVINSHTPRCDITSWRPLMVELTKGFIANHNAHSRSKKKNRALIQQRHEDEQRIIKLEGEIEEGKAHGYSVVREHERVVEDFYRIVDEMITILGEVGPGADVKGFNGIVVEWKTRLGIK